MKKFLLFLALLPGVVSAHGDSTAQSQEVGGYKVELEYSTQGNIMANEFVGYSVHLFDKDDKQLPFDWAFIRIVQGDLPVLSGKAAFDPKLEEGTAMLSGELGKPGTYNAQVTVSKNGQLLPLANFPLTVADAPMQTNSKKFNFDLTSAGLGLVVGGLIVFLWIKQNRGDAGTESRGNLEKN